MPVQNPAILAHSFLAMMTADSYFPDPLVAKGRQILLDLCEGIERDAPVGEAVYALTHAATERFNALDEELHEAESEIETAARDEIAVDVEFILETYGYEVDLEEALAPRDW